MADSRLPVLPNAVSHNFYTVVSDNSTEEETKEYYSDWSPKYDADMVACQYNGPRYIRDAFVSLGLDKAARILDVLGGTGIVAELLAEHGYCNVDGLDGSQEMLDQAQEKNIYKNYICCLIGGEHTAPIEDETYDALVMAGALGPGHIYADVFPDMIRITKTGGYICWVMRATHGQTSPRFRDFDGKVTSLVDSGQWAVHQMTKISDYLLGMDGLIYVMKKL